MSQVDYSVVIPVFKSTDSLIELQKSIDAFMKKRAYQYESIFVEDSGSKASWQVLVKLKEEYPLQVKIVQLSRNYGQNGATLCGLDLSSGFQVITIDDDLQYHPNEIEKLIQKKKENNLDVVYGSPKKNNVSFLRKYGGALIKLLFSKSQGGSSVGSSFRLLDQSIVAKLKNHAQDHLFINQVITWYTTQFGFVEIEHNPRSNGKSGYSLFNLIGISIRLLFYYSSFPLKLLSLIGILGFLFLLAGSFYHYFNHSITWNDFLIQFSLSIILGGIGLLAVYLSRIFSSRVPKPTYSVRKILK